LRRKLMQYIRLHNKTCRPFHWVYRSPSGASVLALLERQCTSSSTGSPAAELEPGGPTLCFTLGTSAP
jgi:hypothetical protein